MNVVHCLLQLYIWKSLKNTGPDDVGGRSGAFELRPKTTRDFSSNAFKTGIKNAYCSEFPTEKQNNGKLER